MGKKLLLLLPLALILVVTSCNKDQKVVKTLDGKWKLVKQDGIAVPAEDATIYEFDNCKLKNEEFCMLTITDSDTTEEASYTVKDDGETLVLRSSFDGLNVNIENEIIELDETTLILKFNFIFTSELEFEKQ